MFHVKLNHVCFEAPGGVGQALWGGAKDARASTAPGALWKRRLFHVKRAQGTPNGPRRARIAWAREITQRAGTDTWAVGAGNHTRDTRTTEVEPIEMVESNIVRSIRAGH
jgi:hypothetical protein